MKFEDSGIDRYEWEALIDRWVFDAKDRQMLKMKILDNASLERIAEEIELSTRQTSRRFEKALKNLIRHI